MIENATSADEYGERNSGSAVLGSHAVYRAAWSHRRTSALRVVQTFAVALLIYLLILVAYVVVATLSQRLNELNSRLDVPLRSTAFALAPEEAWLALTLLAAVVVALNVAVASLADAQGSPEDERPALYARVYSMVLASRLAGIVAAMIGLSALGSIFGSAERTPLGVLDLLALVLSSYLLVVIAIDAREGMTPFGSYESARRQHQWRRRLTGIETARRYWAPPAHQRQLVPTFWWTLGLFAILVLVSVPVRLIRDGRFHATGVPNVFVIAALNLMGAALIGLVLAFAVLFDAITVVAVLLLGGAVMLGFEVWPTFSFWMDSGDFPAWQRVVGLSLNVFFRLACIVHVGLWVGRRTWTLRRGDMIPLLSLLVDAIAGQIAAIMSGRFSMSAKVDRYRLFDTLRRWYDLASGQAPLPDGQPEPLPGQAGAAKTTMLSR
jgi:hypothetical protein